MKNSFFNESISKFYFINNNVGGICLDFDNDIKLGYLIKK